ncbi:Arabinanase/levansucrase/invertase [Teratosphaeria nubilosa]|uniref:Arabinanase/levansucrase/invertase n=1 Tax=Teratosphaeria nubilosa TaxID=161662 RepID=A0A6G1L5B9_9PEZI|nr:Arabinanase/levansucrase/invertase [Teratosphaeria nubilosa]
MDLARRTALATALFFDCFSFAAVIDYYASPPNISTLFNNTIYYTWRPKSHVLPPYGHAGDPCRHFYDPADGSFHVGYLYSAGVGPSGIAGAITNDLVTYFDVDEDPTIIYNGGINDPVAVFDGSVIPSGINGNPTLLYTSVSYLPIQWTIPYTKGSETQSLAVTYDGGRNFTSIKEGPVIPGPPFPITNPTGFRDPYVFHNPRLDRAVASANGTWYTTISGGIHDVGPRVFLFRQYDADFRDWEYLGEWWHEPINSTWGEGTWAGRWGFNFETVNVFSLSQTGYDPEGMIFTTNGAEWSEAPIIPQVSQFREMLWAAHNLTTGKNGSVHLEPIMAGKLDWGIWAYAAAGKFLPSGSTPSEASGTSTDRFVIYLWLTNNDFGTNDFPTAQQGWDGALTTVRELAEGTISNVVDNGLIAGPASWIHMWHSYLRPREPSSSQAARLIASNSSGVNFMQSPISKAFILKTCLTFPSGARNSSDLRAGLRILTSDQESTIVYYQFFNESLIIDRSNSSAASATTPGILNNNEVGRLRLFDIASTNGTVSIERLDLTILVDNSIVEVFANERFVLSTWVWSWYAESTQLAFFHEGSVGVEFGNVTVWEGLVDAWPARSY